MTHWKALCNTDYLGAYSLASGNGYSELVARIESVKQELVTGADGKKETCTVAHLEGQKPMILNRTNCKAIEKALGTPMIESWPGQFITIYVSRVKAFGDVVDALRIKPVKPKLEEKKPVFCECCDNEIKPAYAMTVAQIVKHSQKNYNGTYCAACMKKFKEAQESDNGTDQQ